VSGSPRNDPARTLDATAIDRYFNEIDWKCQEITRWATLLQQLPGAASQRPDTSAPAR
jgi:hypothetical protein